MKLSLILVNYNTKKYLQSLLPSLKNCLKSSNINHQNTEVIIIDNASTDNSIQFIKQKHSWAKLIIAPKNLGFAAGNNLGITKAKGKYIMLLNTDIIIEDNLVFSKLVNYLEKHIDVAVITPKLTLPDGAIDLACHRGFPTPWNAFTYFAKLEQLFPNFKLFSGYHQTWKDFNTAHQVDAVAGAALMTRKEVIDQVGPLDERFPMYAEDLDWCKRIKLAGWKIIFFPQATIIHLKSQAGKAKKSHTPEHQFATQSFYQTMKQFYQKHYQEQYPGWIKHLVFLGINLMEKIKNNQSLSNDS